MELDTRTTPTGYSWRNPSGLTLPMLGHARSIIHDAGPRWEGVIIARTWADGFTEGEYRLLLAGGSRRRLARPDAVSALGAPVYHLSDRERRIRDRLLDRLCVGAAEAHNIACNAGRTVLLDFLAGSGSPTGASYFAVGTGSPPVGSSGPAATDTQLWSEYYRAAISTYTVSGNQFDASTIFASGVANTTYTEAGLFGNGASGTANSGSLFAHALYAYPKSAGTILTNDYYVSFA